MLGLIVSFVGAGIIVVVIALFVEWTCGNWPPSKAYDINTKAAGDPTIDFDMFLNLYTIAPEKWIISQYENYPMYYNDPDDYWSKETVRFNTYKDAKRYLKWRDNRCEQRQNKEKNKTQEKFLTYWQKDIEDYRKQSRQDLSNEFTKLYQYCEEIGSSQEVLDMIMKSKKVFDK